MLGDAFNAGDLEVWASHLDDSFTGMASDTFMGSPAEFMAATRRNGRSHGWTGQHMVSVSAHDNLLTVHYVNEFADGTKTCGAGVALFNDDGKIVAIRALEQLRRHAHVAVHLRSGGISGDRRTTMGRVRRWLGW